MPELKTPQRVFAVATGNSHKVDEIQAVLGPLGIRAVTADEAMGLSGGGSFVMPEETGATFEENSRIKAEALAAALGGEGNGLLRCTRNDEWGGGNGVRNDSLICGVIADDSGLCVDALDGAPGVYSARYAGTGLDPDNTGRLLRELYGVAEEGRTARFVCVITLVRCEGVTQFRGECEGRITDAPRGSSGFGYDPVFVPTLPDELGDTRGAHGASAYNVFDGRTFAELSPDEKNLISHRARALSKLYAALSQRADL